MLKPIRQKPPFPFDRPISWSQVSSFEYSPSRWYRSYVLGERETSPEMEFGSMVDKRIQADPSYIPAIRRLPRLQYELRCSYGDMDLVGFPDALDLDNPELIDYKTGRKKWDKKRADETGQLTMYLLMIWINHKIRPEEFLCKIQWMPTHIENGKVSFVDQETVLTFETSRTMADIVKFGQRIADTRKKMIEYYDRQP